jgi:hypothetical protein
MAMPHESTPMSPHLPVHAVFWLWQLDAPGPVCTHTSPTGHCVPQTSTFPLHGSV